MSHPRRPIISLLTDFGTDGAAATCKGVMLTICPDAQVIDVTHSVPKFAIRDGAFILRAALPYLPIGVHVAVVDPGVGTARRPIAVKVQRGDVLIGPDNGLLMSGADALGGISQARELANQDLWLPVTTSTFHGRDLFSPVAAHLAEGDASFADVGPPVDAGSLTRLSTPAASVREGAIDTVVTYVDSFGNLRLAGGQPDLASAFGALAPGHRFEVNVATQALTDVAFATTFGDLEPGAVLLYIDSTGDLALAESQGNLAGRLSAGTNADVAIRRPG